MTPWYVIVWSSVGRKIVTAFTGLFLFLFIVIHLLANLELFNRNPIPFNSYANFLEGLGIVIWILEALILLSFIFHIVVGGFVWFWKMRARGGTYEVVTPAGPPSHKTFSSTSMILSGLVIAVFTTIHIITMKYGPGVAQGYITSVNGVQMRDLYRLAIEVFRNKYWVIFYVAVMIVLFFHLRHAFWSGFQSLGANNARLIPVLYGIGFVLAILLSMGFLLIPLWIYFRRGVS